jgi:hypothetical protein
VWPVCQVADGANARANVVGRCKSGFQLENSAFSGVISPEDACLFGASCASALSSGRICVSHDGTPGGSMLAQAAQAGAASAGSRVFSCGKAELAALVFSGMQKNCDVCLYAAVKGGEASVTVLGQNTLLDPGRMKKVQQIFQRGDFPRQPYDALRDIIRDNSAQECYDVWKKALLAGKSATVYGDADGAQTVYIRRARRASQSRQGGGVDLCGGA